MDRQLLAVIRIHDAFRGLSDDDIQTVVDSAEIMEVAGGVTLHQFNEQLDSLYLIVQGRLKLTMKAPGGEQKTVRYSGSSDQIGALMLFTGDEFPFQITVDEKAVLLRLDSSVAKAHFERFPEFRRNLLRKAGIGIQNVLFRQQKRSFAKIVSCIHVDAETRSVISDVVARLVSAGERIGVLCDDEYSQFPEEVPVRLLLKSDGDYLAEADVREIVKSWRDFDRVFVVVDRALPLQKVARLVELCDIVFCLATIRDAGHAAADLERLYQMTPSWKSKTHFVWGLRDNEQVVPVLEELGSLVERDFKVHLSRDGDLARFRKQGVERMVRYLRGISIGIALSGGAAHGMAHLGVLKAIDEAGITIDKLAGTSAGVLTGVVYCAGFTPDFGIEHFTRDLEPGSIYKRLPMGDGVYVLRKYRTNKWGPMLRKYFHDWRIEQLPIPLYTVATDLVSAAPVVRESGDAVDSVLESINLPILSDPICRDGMLLVDGGVVNNLPADILVKNGCNFVIGVDVAANIEHQVGVNRPGMTTAEMKSPGIVATLVRCLRVLAHNMSDVGARAADVIIAPDVSGIDPTAFVRTPEMAEIGYRTTEKMIPRIREILHNMDPGLFPG